MAAAQQHLGMRQQQHCSSSAAGMQQRSARSCAPARPVRAMKTQRIAPFSSSSSSSSSRATVVACPAGKLDEVSLFADSSLLGPSSKSSAASGPADVDSVKLESKLGLDYKPLAQHLKDGDFRKADDETRALLIKMAGAGAVARGWVYFTEVKTIPVEDLRTVDLLWKAGSKGKFGYSVQRELFAQCARRWPKFFKQIDWTVGENSVYRKWPAEFIYSMDAPKGHLPLTNALRGTQLFEALLQHPAFEREGGAKGPSIDDKAKAAGANTLKF